jgi:hypothetical protein
MNNFEIIELVEKITSSYFKFNIEYFYGDRGSCEYPKIEEMNILFFKFNGKDRKLAISKNEQTKIVDEINNLNVGLVDFIKDPHCGKFIVIQPYKI